MRRFLLMFVSALLCTLGMSAMTGSGTEADPYVVSDGDTYTIPAGEKVYISFTAPGDGTLRLTPTVNPWGMLGFVCGNVGLAEDFGSGRVAYLGVSGGDTYVIYNNGTPFDTEFVAVSFEEAGASAFTIVSADPAQDTPIASLSAETAITLTASSGVGYVTAMLRDTGDSEVAYQLSAAVDEADPTRIVLSYQWGKIDLYEGHAYEITVTAYASYDDWLTGQAAIGSAVVRYAGATEAVESMARVVSVSPEPGVLYPTADQMLSRAEGRRAVTIEFDGKVSVQMCAILLGYGTSTDCESVTAEATAEGHTVVTAVIPESFFTRHYEALLSITVTDENGNKLDDKDGPYARFFSGGSYVFDFALADARVADASMQASEVVPAAGSYVEALDTVALTVTGEVPVAVTYKANAGLYRDGAKAYDVKLTTDVDGSGFVTMDNRHVYATFYEPGTDTKVTVTEPGSYVLRIDSLSIADANMDVDAPWVDGYSGKGICNPDWEFEYTVVRELPAVVAVDPEPYTEGGEYSQEIPAEVRITANTDDIHVNMARVRYGMNSSELAEWSVEGSVITVRMPASVAGANSVTLIVNATTADGIPFAYNDEDGMNIILTYQTPANILVPTEVTPADGSKVAELSAVTLRVPGQYNIGDYDASKAITLTDASGSTVAIGAFGYDEEDFGVAIITLNKTVAEAGTYTLTIPENTFTSLDGTVYNPELSYTFTVDPTLSGIGATAADGSADVEVYTLGGVLVARGQAAGVLGSLKPGVYVVNGRKVAVR